MANSDQQLNNLIRELLGEIVDLAPQQLSTTATATTTSAVSARQDASLEPSVRSEETAPDRRALFALTAVFVLVIAGASLWVVTRDSAPVETTAPPTEEPAPPVTGDVGADVSGNTIPVEALPYRYIVEESNGLAAEGIVDPETSRASISLDPFGIEAFADGETVTSSDGVTFSNPDELTLFFADRTRTMALIEETFTVGEWEEVGPATVNGGETTEFQASVSAEFGQEIFITDSVVGFFELFGPWEGTIRVFVRENGLVARLNLDIGEESGFRESLQLDYFDIEGPVEFN